jgi:hypothetical protein
VWKALPDEVILALARLAVPDIGTTLIPWKTDLKVLFDREVDNAYLISVKDLRALLHLEYQNYADSTMPRRVFHYNATLKLSYFQQQHEDIAVLSIVIWAIKGNHPAPIYESAVTEDTGIVCRYREIHLGALDWQTVDPVLLVLAPFLQGVEPGNLETVAVQMYEAAPPAYRVLLLGALLNMSKRVFRDIDEIEQAILQRVRVTMDEIFEAIAEGPIGIALIERGKTEGKAEGKMQGIAEGKVQGIAEGKVQGIAEGEAKGKTEGLLAAITVIWQGRFGPLAADVTTALQQASMEQLQQVVAAFAGTPTEEELRGLLGL